MGEMDWSIEIARPPEEVFAFVADPHNDPRWCPHVRSCRQVEGERPAGGARYELVHKPSRLKPAATLVTEIHEFDPPRRIRMREEDGDGVFDVTYELEPTPSGTRFIQSDRIEWKLPRFFHRMADRHVNSDVEAQMAALKSLLES